MGFKNLITVQQTTGGGGEPTFVYVERNRRSDSISLPKLTTGDASMRADALNSKFALLEPAQRMDAYKIPSAQFLAAESLRRAESLRFPTLTISDQRARSDKTTVSVLFTTAGTRSFTVPPGVTQMVMEVWGAGGGGGTATVNSGGGGKGGAYARRNSQGVTGGQALSVVVAGSAVAAGAASRVESGIVTSPPRGQINNINIGTGNPSYGATDANAPTPGDQMSQNDFRITFGDGTAAIDFTVPQGPFTVSQYVTAFNAASPVKVTASYDSVTGVLTYTGNEGGAIKTFELVNLSQHSGTIAYTASNVFQTTPENRTQAASDSTGSGTVLLQAAGGNPGGNGNATAGGTGATAQNGTSTGDVTFSGGNGANGTLTAGGSGGGGAGSSGNATGATGSAQLGGNGGASGGDGSVFGGGGGGATTLAGRGAGAQGAVRLTFTI